MIIKEKNVMQKTAPVVIMANWKMYDFPLNKACEFVSRLKKYITENKTASDIVICPQFPLISAIKAVAEDSPVCLGGQNCSGDTEGAFTGEVSAGVLKDIGCDYVIVGHSERRLLFNESNRKIMKKISEIQKNNMTSVVCIGETSEDRNKNLQEEVIYRQLTESIPEDSVASKIIIAYEPVWAIGSSKSASYEEIEEMSEFIYDVVLKKFKQHSDSDIRIIYGGSVSEDNSEKILSVPHINGLLIGKTSLNIDSFIKIIDSYNRK